MPLRSAPPRFGLPPFCPITLPHAFFHRSRRFWFWFISAVWILLLFIPTPTPTLFAARCGASFLQWRPRKRNVVHCPLVGLPIVQFCHYHGSRFAVCTWYALTERFAKHAGLCALTQTWFVRHGLPVRQHAGYTASFCHFCAARPRFCSHSLCACARHDAFKRPPSGWFSRFRAKRGIQFPTAPKHCRSRPDAAAVTFAVVYGCASPPACNRIAGLDSAPWTRKTTAPCTFSAAVHAMPGFLHFAVSCFMYYQPRSVHLPNAVCLYCLPWFFPIPSRTRYLPTCH